MYDLPDTALHHAIDRRIMDASNDVIKTINICPPDIYRARYWCWQAGSPFSCPDIWSSYGGPRSLSILGRGFYFAVADEVRWKEAAEAICRLGIEQGWLQLDAKTVSYDEKCFREVFEPGWLGVYLWASDS
ncbi:uncharacterized protein PADG_04794 [Paracoccidioides brasiliensis Pb18]|uniref:Uncharacterized protein n=1 Tax=Paracoccidioides brasiliensis (strain Pb18) TaxID=502780 RepID=C1GCS2_PARBD|nr:uncharacterized protein PADG_04794 [Paracoccidioides brasiliensis Pb18]EEH48715.2 hypothetical protein PADG_04794 [Paracoccidioides brasiliensis Pb18]